MRPNRRRRRWTLRDAGGSGGAPEGDGRRVIVKLSESPFYAAGGGQVSDAGVIECEQGDCRAHVEEVLRLGDDQAVVVHIEQGSLEVGERVLARVDHAARHATECNHTATHLLHAALRERLGPHVRQAGSYVGPDKLRFDFSHGQALSAQQLRDVEDRVNAWIQRNDAVRAVQTTLAEARKLGAMALFGEKYGDVVRMVQIGDGHYSRELCGGTHVASTAEIGLFHVTSETSSAANVRRIEALTGPAGVGLMRHHVRLLRDAASALRSVPDAVPGLVVEHEQQRRELERRLRAGDAPGAGGGPDAAVLAAAAQDVDGARVLATAVEVGDAEGWLLELADRVKGALAPGPSAVVLGTSAAGRVHLVAVVEPALVERGVRAGAIVAEAARVVGGGGGGEGATRSPRRAGATRPSCPTRWRLPGARSRPRSASRRTPDGARATGAGARDARPGPRLRQRAVRRGDQRSDRRDRDAACGDRAPPLAAWDGGDRGAGGAVAAGSGGGGVAAVAVGGGHRPDARDARVRGGAGAQAGGDAGPPARRALHDAHGQPPGRPGARGSGGGLAGGGAPSGELAGGRGGRAGCDA